MGDAGLTVLAQYEEVAKMSENPSGQVFLVRHTLTGQFYIKKILRSYDAGTYQVLAAAQDLAGIPTIHYLDETDGGLVIVEDYIHGKNYEQLRQEQKLDTDDVLRAALSLCRILIPLHALQPAVIHRDIKPSNVILSADGVVKLIDFNAARLYKEDTEEDTSKLGTVGFAAPEQFGFSQTDARTDIYALGVFMNVLLTGRRPMDLLALGPLGPIIKKCVEFLPQDRYQSVEELQAVLSRLAQNRSGRMGVLFRTEDSKDITTSWHLPGFRTHMLWKGVLAVFGYGCILLTMVIQNAGDQMSRSYSWDSHITMALWLFLEVLFAFNYRGIRDSMPMMHHKQPAVRIIFGIIWGFALTCVVVAYYALIGVSIDCLFPTA